MLLTDALLLDYKRCQRRAYLNVYGNFWERDAERDFLLKLRQESQKHIAQVLEESFPVCQEPLTPKAQWSGRSLETQQLMKQGAEVIFNGCLSYQIESPNATEQLVLVGHPHLLVKQPGQCRWGDWQYYPVSIQLGRRPKPEYKIIVAFYAELLGIVQGHFPNRAEIILRRQNAYHVDLAEWLPRLQDTLQDWISLGRQEPEPEVFISRQRCSLCHWHSHCYGIAQAQQHLSLVPGVTPSRYQSLQSLGVNTIASLATVSFPLIEDSLGQAIAHQLQRQAIALVENQAFLKSTKVSPLPQAELEIYFDIEAEPERNLDYLLGVIVVNHRTQEQQFHAFFAETVEDEEQIWQAFLAFIEQYPKAPIFHFSEYEVETIKRLATLYQTPKRHRDQLVKRCFDLHRYVVNTVILPVESYSLKSLANWLGFQWRDAGASGDQSVCWYDQWLSSGDRLYQELILRYNEDDCQATWILKDWLTQFLASQGSPKAP